MKKELFFVLFILINSNDIFKQDNNNINNNFKISCGINKIKQNVKIYKRSKSEKAFSSKKRKLSDEEFQPIRLYISQMLLELSLNFQTSLKAELKKIINEIIEYTQKLIKVKPLNYEIKVDNQMLKDNLLSYVFEDGSQLYDNSLINGVSADLVVALTLDFPPEIYTRILLNDEETNRTIFSAIYLPYSLITTNMNKNNFQQIKYMIFHELTHILGFLYDSFQFFPGGLNNTVKRQVDSRGINRMYIITPTVVDLAKKYYNCEDIIGLELEDRDQDKDFSSSHWEARILLGEYMNSEFYKPEIVISDFTLALLEDSKWYKVNYFTGGLMRFGKNRGCEFLNNDCCDSDGVTKFKNEFFDYEDNNNPSCSSGRTSRTYNLVKAYSSIPYRSFLNGGMTENADYCFAFINSNEEDTNSNLFVGNCNMGNGDYGSKINYNGYVDYKNVFQNDFGESFSNQSFCVLSEAFPKGSTEAEYNHNFQVFNSIIHPICYQMFCNYSLTIKMKDQYVVCPRKGGKVEVNGDFTGYIYCPDYNLICTGIKVCNEMFDCIQKESLSENLIYDYDFDKEKTSSQKISQIKNEIVSYGYEINDDGICPEYCTQCRNIKRCFKCIEGYKLLGVKHDDTNPIICDNTTNISIGYFIYNEVYYKCIDFCDECDSSYTCIKCDNIHKTDENRICIDKVEHCESYNATNNYTCQKCKGGYAFIGYDRDNCYIINYKEKYYTLDNGISYFPCNTIISNCEVCNNNKDKCSKCENNYYFLYDNRTFCFGDKNLSKYYSEDEGISYKFCNDSIPFCDTCDQKTICQTCGQNHYFIKEDRINCVTGYDLHKYYTEDNGLSYYPCSEAIDNCIECDARDNCQRCENNYYLLSTSRDVCKRDIDKSKYYTDDDIIYYPCNTFFDYCEECRDKNTCTKCMTEYGFLGTDRSQCHFVNNNEYYSEDKGISFYPCYKNLPYCEKCLNKTFCTKCQENNYFIANDRTKCVFINDFNYYYTEDNGFSYYPCSTGIPNCQNCTNKYSCTQCKSNYYFIGNNRQNCINIIDRTEYYTLDEGISYLPCHEAMDYCKNCDNPNICIKCQQNAYFLKEDRTKCYKLNVKEYYTEDEISYYPCIESMDNCLECYNKNFCGKCITNYFLKFEIPDTCFDVSTFQNDKTYYQMNETHYKKCSSTISNCIYCNSGTECTLCENDYYFIDEKWDKCVHKNKIKPEDEYIKIDDYNYYSCGYYKIVENCQKCVNTSSCIMCKEGFAFQSDMYNKCYSKEDMEKGFYHNEDETMYYPCRSNCDFCTNAEDCSQCSPNYEFIFEKTMCERCLINILNIEYELNLQIVHSLAQNYLSETRFNNYSYILYYINQNKNYSILIFRSWECTTHLFELGYFDLDTYSIAKKIIEKNGEELNSLAYVFVNYNDNKNYIEIYNSNNHIINLKQLCPECLNIDYTIRNNLTDILVNSFGKEILKNIILNNINIFNESDPVFSDFCYNFTIQSIDLPLKERRKMLYLGSEAKETICLDSTCEIYDISINEYTGTCQCKIQTELSLILEEKISHNPSFSSNGINNFPIFTCSKEGFDKTNLKTNAGFFIGLVVIVIQIAAFVFYILKSKSPKMKKIPASPPIPPNSSYVKNGNSDILFLEDFEEIMKENGKKMIEDEENKEMDYQDKDDLSEDLASQDEELENRKTFENLLSTEMPLTQRGKRNTCKSKDFNALNDKKLDFDTYSVQIHSEKKLRNEKLIMKDSENENTIKFRRNKNREKFSQNSDINSKSSFETIDEFNIKDIQKKNFSSRVYNSLKEAKKFNQTSFWEYYCLLIGLRQPIINLFVMNKCIYLGEDYVPFTIKIIRLIFLLSLNIFMNVLHLNHNYFYDKFEYFDKKYDIRNKSLEKGISSSELFSYAFKNSILISFISFVFCYLVQELLNRFIINNRKDIDKLINSTIGKVKDEKLKEVLRKQRKKYIILSIINFALMLVFYFCITNFYGPYRGGIIDYLAAFLMTFIFMQIFPFVICLVFAVIRHFGIRNSNEKLFNIGQILIY